MTSLHAFLAAVQARKAEAGMVDDPAATDALRNRGARRTDAKRELLRRAEARALTAGRPPVKAYF